MKREPGFYWVKPAQGGPDWEVGHYTPYDFGRAAGWFLAGENGAVDESSLLVDETRVERRQ